MRVAFFDTREYEIPIYRELNESLGFQCEFFQERLTWVNAHRVVGFDAVCSFVNDELGPECLAVLHSQGVKVIALRSAGYDHVDLACARKLGIAVCHVPSYSPESIAEFAIGLMLSVSRHIHRAHRRTHNHDFRLNDLVGFTLKGSTIGIVGAGRIGSLVAKVLMGFGCRVLIHDLVRDQALEKVGCKYLDLRELCQSSDLISLHLPLNSQTYHIVNSDLFNLMKRGAILVNTARGGLVDSHALIEALDHGKIGGAALDVYENEGEFFSRDFRDKILPDETLARLVGYPNVLLTPHQAYLSREALENIARVTMQSLEGFRKSGTIREENRL